MSEPRTRLPIVVRLLGAVTTLTLLVACGSAPRRVQPRSAGNADSGSARLAAEPPSSDGIAACLDSKGVAFVLVPGDGDSVGVRAPDGAGEAGRRDLERALESCRPAPEDDGLGPEEEARIVEGHLDVLIDCFERAEIKVQVRWDEGHATADLQTPELDQSSSAFQGVLGPCSAQALTWERTERKRLGGDRSS